MSLGAKIHNPLGSIHHLFSSLAKDPADTVKTTMNGVKAFPFSLTFNSAPILAASGLALMVWGAFSRDFVRGAAGAYQVVQATGLFLEAGRHAPEPGLSDETLKLLQSFKYTA